MEDIYEIQARYYANLPLLDRKYIASVHVENKEDTLFWNTMLQRVKKGEYYFISHSKTSNGNEASGCEQCLKYLPFLSKRFFIAIDSDLRYARQEPGLDAKHFVAQTYTYSWESHFCEANDLQHRFEMTHSPARTLSFDFIRFLEQLSSILYKPFLYAIYTPSAKITDIFNCLPSQFSSEGLSATNGQKLLSEIQARLDEKNLEYSEEKASMTAERLLKLGITENNVYLHVRGHNLFDMIRPIGIILCRGTRISFTKDILMQCPGRKASYWQLLKVQSDLRAILLNGKSK